MHRELTSAQLTELMAYARIDAVPDSELEKGDRLSAKAKILFAPFAG